MASKPNSVASSDLPLRTSLALPAPSTATNNRKYTPITLTPSALHSPDPKYPSWHELKDLGCFRSADTLPMALCAALEGGVENPRPLQLMLEFLKSQPNHVLLSCADTLICKGLPVILDQVLGHEILDTYSEIWNLLNNLAPEKLWPLTVNSAVFLPADTPKVSQRFCCLQDLFEDPLLLYRIHPNFFQIPQLFQIFLTVSAKRLANHPDDGRHQQCVALTLPPHLPLPEHQAAGNAASGTNPQTICTLEQVWAMIYLQDTAVIQMLFEICLNQNHARNPGKARLHPLIPRKHPYHPAHGLQLYPHQVCRDRPLHQAGAFPDIRPRLDSACRRKHSFPA